MKHTIALTTCLLALACQPARSSDDPDDSSTAGRSGLPKATRPEPSAIAADQAVFIRQYEPGPPQSWRFEPGGQRISSMDGAECGVWQFEDGVYLGHTPGGLEAAPCKAWNPSEPLAWVEGPISLGHPDGKRQILVDGERFEVSGTKLGGRARGGRYQAAALSPDGVRLALFVGDPRGDLTIEVWNLDAARRERTLDFDREEVSDYDPQSWLAKRYWLHWNDRSLRAVVDLERPCDYANELPCDGRVVLAHAWADLEDEPETRRFPNPDEEFGEDVEQVYIDAERHVLLVWISGRIPDDGRIANALDGVLLSDLSDIVDPLETFEVVEEDVVEEEEEEEVASEANLTRTNGWSDLVGANHWSIVERDCCYEFEIGWLWSNTTIRSIPEQPVELTSTSGFIGYRQPGVEQAFAPRTPQLLTDTTICPSDNDESGDEKPCVAAPTLPDGCAAIDASWSLDQLLLVCDDRWVVATKPAFGEAVELASMRELARGTGGPYRVVWGPEGLAIWTFSEGLRLFEAERLVASHAEIRDLHPAVLDEELDLALVRTSEGLRVADLRRFELGPTLAWKLPVDHAAFAPDRSRVAIAGGGELGIDSLDDGHAIVRWSSGKLAGMAFRQDGEVLYVGATQPLPELALDPNTGELVAEAQLDRVAFERLAHAALDPSWRWALEGPDTFLRTIDGQALNLYDSTSALAESGWFVGDIGYRSPRVRIGPEPLTPVYELEALADQLARPDLIAEFFAGKPLPRPILKPPQPPPGSR